MVTQNRDENLSLDDGVKDRLVKLAERTNRDPSELANAALRDFVAYEERFIGDRKSVV